MKTPLLRILAAFAAMFIFLGACTPSAPVIDVDAGVAAAPSASPEVSVDIDANGVAHTDADLDDATALLDATAAAGGISLEPGAVVVRDGGHRLGNSLATDLYLSGQAQGAIAYFSGTQWVVLGPGTANNVLTTHGAGANPTWAAGGGGSTTWANDLAGSTSTNQYVASISGNAGGGGTITINATPLSFASGQSSPTLKQADLTTNSGTGQPLTVQAQNETGTTSVGGILNLTSGTGTSSAGQVNIQTGGTTQVNVTPSTITLTPIGLVWSGSSGAPTVGQAQRPGTGANAGNTLDIIAQSGQNVAAGTNNNGGILALQGGVPGSGGTGGSPGPVNIYAGSTQVASFGNSTANDFAQFGVMTNGLSTGMIRLPNNATGIRFDGNAAGRYVNAVNVDSGQTLLIGSTAALSSGGAFSMVLGLNGGNWSVQNGGSNCFYSNNTYAAMYGSGGEQLRTESSGVSIGGVTGSYGGGTGVVFIANGTIPTSVPTGGGIVSQNSTGLHYAGPSTSFQDWMLAPSSQGSINTQNGKSPIYSGFARTTTNAAVTALTIPLATSGTVGAMTVTATGRDVSGGTVGDGFTQNILFQYKNVGGTVTAAATNAVSMAKVNDTSMASCTVTGAVSGTNVLIQVTGLTSTTIDWTVEAQVIVNSITGLRGFAGARAGAPLVLAVGALAMALRRRRAANDNADSNERAA